MAKFCGKCGSRLDEATGLCPECDAELLRKTAVLPADPEKKNDEIKPETPLSKKEIRKQKKADKKSEKKKEKKLKKENRSIGQKIQRFFLKLLILVLVLLLLFSAFVFVGTYFGFIHYDPLTSLLQELDFLQEETSSQAETSTQEETSSQEESSSQEGNDIIKDDNIYIPDEKNIVSDEDENISYVNNIIIIIFDKNAAQSDIDTVIDSVNGTVVGKMPSINQYQISIKESSLDELREIVSDVEKYDCVLFAHYDRAYDNLLCDAGPNDPWNGDVDDMDWKDSYVDGSNWWAEAIDAYGAWQYNNEFSRIKIGIVDNGFDTGHEDLTVTFPLNFVSINSKEDHGTHVAGIIGAKTDNGKGINGIVNNCDLICFDWEPTYWQKKLTKWNTSSMVYSGLIYTVYSGAKIINFSIGAANADTYSQALIDEWGEITSGYMATLLATNDFVVVQSAGNEGIDAINNGFFASVTNSNCVDWGTGNASKQNILDRILISAAVQQSDEGYIMSCFSNSGSQVNICAPGGDGSGEPDKDIYSTVTGGLRGGYNVMYGTSMAAPMVTGAAALVWSANEKLTGADVTDIICNSTNIIVNDNPDTPKTSGSHPMVNAKLAVEEAIRRREPEVTTSDERDIVLVLDRSGSMNGKPIDETKKASANFIDTVLDEDASIGVVAYDVDATMLSDFSVDNDFLTDTVSELETGGVTNIESGLAKAQEMLKKSTAKKKIIVLMSDGKPNEGKQGDELISYANKLKDNGIIIYTIGFFESLDEYKSSAQVLMEEIASDGCHYEVADADELVFFFGDIAEQLNGQKYIYIRIACPVDVSVTYNGETLCSAEDKLNMRTDFGTLTFEENDNCEVPGNSDNTIKVLRLKEGTDYDVNIEGTGRGLMNYTIGFMDENGDYSDLRRFENIKITRHTQIDTVATVSEESILRIDENGDGKYDKKLRAEENGYGEEVKQDYKLYIIIISTILLLCVLVIFIVHKLRKKKGTVKRNG